MDCGRRMSGGAEKIIAVIKTGSASEVRAAQKDLDKYWENIRNDKAARTALLNILLEEVRRLDQLEDDDHRAYLINALKWRLWENPDENFERWMGFVLKYILHPSGKVRIAVVRACEYLSLELDITSDCMEEGSNTTPEVRDKYRKKFLRFGFFVSSVEELISRYYEPRFSRYKYTSSIPPSVYKSLQQLITEVLLRSEFHEKMYEDYSREFGRQGRA